MNSPGIAEPTFAPLIIYFSSSEEPYLMTAKTSARKAPALRFKTGADIRQMRDKLGLNQAEFWSRVGVTQSGGSRYESGRNIPKPVQLLLHLTYGTDKQSADLLTWLRTSA